MKKMSEMTFYEKNVEMKKIVVEAMRTMVAAGCSDIEHEYSRDHKEKFENLLNGLEISIAAYYEAQTDLMRAEDYLQEERDRQEAVDKAYEE